MNLPQAEDLSSLASLADVSRFSGDSDIDAYAMHVFKRLDIRSDFWFSYTDHCDALMSRGATVKFIEQLTVRMESLYSAALVRHFYDRFCHRDNCYFYAVKQSTGKVEYFKREAAVTRSLFESHLLGDITLSLPACTEDGRSKWCCFDFDCEDEDLVQRLIDLLSNLTLHSIRDAARPGRSGHVWLLFDDLVDTDDLIVFGKYMLSVIYKEYKNVEFFPSTSTGHSQMRLPLGVHLKPEANGDRGWFEGPERNIRSQLIWLTQQPLNAVSPIQNIAGVLRSQATQKIQYERPAFARSYEDVNWFGIGIDWQLRSGEYQARCPLCADENRDNSCDNLRLNLDGTKINCVLGGPNTTHKTKDIYKRFGFCQKSR